MHSVLLGFVLVWVSSFLIFSWMMWRAPVMEEVVDEMAPSDVRHSGAQRTA